jgi:hypothetical protein
MSDEAKASTKAEKPAAPPAVPPTVPAAEDKRSPRDWAIALGHAPTGKPQLADEGTVKMLSGPRGSAEYHVAKAMHGWEEHEFHEGTPMLLSRADFEAALKASHPPDVYVAADGKGTTTEAEKAKRDAWNNPVLDPKMNGNPKPHPAALSKHLGNKVRVSLDKGEHRIDEAKAN